jgi:hypothetical protein
MFRVLYGTVDKELGEGSGFGYGIFKRRAGSSAENGKIDLVL